MLDESTNWLAHDGNTDPWYSAGLGDDGHAFDGRTSREESDWIAAKCRTQETLPLGDSGIEGAARTIQEGENAGIDPPSLAPSGPCGSV